MYSIGQDHCQNGIAHKDLQIASHRIDHKIEWNLSDGELKHLLLYGVHKDGFYTRDDINLDYILDECKAEGIVPMINNNAPYLDRNIPVAEYARRCRLIDLILYEYGFKKAFTSVINEPGKFYDTPGYCPYVNASKKAVKYFPIVAGNDEYNMLDWNFLLDNANFDYLGVHPLSSLGYPPNYNMLASWASMAKARGRGVMATEAGPWFKSYSSSEGWAVIKNIILKCKYHGYEAVCIVCVDINEDHPILGFRRFDKNYTRLVHTSPYWDDFINLVNREGSKYKEEVKEGVKDGMIIKTIGHKTTDVKSGYGVKLLHELLINRGYINEDDIGSMFVYDSKTKAAVENFQTDLGITVDGRIGRQTWRKFISKIPEAAVKKDFQFNLEVVMSPYNLKGDT
ncbi:unnamed protein product [marine sediment metagenome]|uniref:Peptidoglycan binding-like domain-containing protein n=1 Tax=marine sediment metagenome TaxID=412755 RepID=X1GN10_9ZZZZ